MADFLQSPIPEVLVNQRLVPATQQLTDGAPINIDASLGDVCVVTLGGNRTLAAPTNPKGGQHLTLIVKQDGTGSRTLAFNAVFSFAGTVTLNSTASSTTIYEFVYDAAAVKWTCVASTASIGGSASVASIISGTVTVTGGGSTGTASVGAAYNGKPVILTLKDAVGAIHATFVPGARGAVAGGTLTVTLVDKDNVAANAASNVTYNYLIDGR